MATKREILLIVAFLCGAVACESRKDSLSTPAEEEAATEIIISNYNYREVPDRLLVLRKKEGIDSLARPLEGNLFGKFFSDRVEFFIVKKPTNRVCDTNVNSLTLYYLDGRLSQTKFLLEENASDKLIALYGGFRITGYDAKNREIIKSNQVLEIEPEGVKLNSELDNFELKWDIGHAQVAYKVNQHDQFEPYKYFERLKDFESIYKSIRIAEY